MNVKEKQKKALGIVWMRFSYNKSAIARAAGVDQSAVQQWFTRGRISATGAIALNNHELLRGVITKEEMRPDVKEWFGV